VGGRWRAPTIDIARAVGRQLKAFKFRGITPERPLKFEPLPEAAGDDGARRRRRAKGGGGGDSSSSDGGGLSGSDDLSHSSLESDNFKEVGSD